MTDAQMRRLAEQIIKENRHPLGSLEMRLARAVLTSHNPDHFSDPKRAQALYGEPKKKRESRAWYAVKSTSSS
jgi:hypothetical protein